MTYNIDRLTLGLRVALYAKYNGNYFRMIKEAVELLGKKPPLHFKHDEVGTEKTYTLTETKFLVNGNAPTPIDEVMVFHNLTKKIIERKMRGENNG